MSGSTYLSEYAARILSELEEAGVENFSSTVNTVCDRPGVEREMISCIDALNELVGSRLAVLSPDGVQELTAEHSIELLLTLASMVKFDPEEGLWKWNKKSPIVEIIATEKGRELAFEILDERGYQWCCHQDSDESA